MFLLGALLLTVTGAHAACPQKHSRADTFMELSVPEGARRPADASAFSVVDGEMTIAKLFVAVGPPDASDGETTTIYVYCLPDGSEVRVGTRDGTTIDYVRHDRKELYKRKKK
jgi:hypothetical protein